MEEINFDQLAILPATLGLADESIEPERRELLVLRARGGHLIGVFADEARSISDDYKLTPLPHAPPAVLGVACIRGRMHTVLDPALLLAPEAVESSQETPPLRFLVALGGDEQLALIVEEVNGIIELLSDELQPLNHAGKVVAGVVQKNGNLIALLARHEMFAAAMQGTERRRKRW